MLCFTILAVAANGGNQAGDRNSQGRQDDAGNADREADNAAGHRMCKKLFSTIDYPL